ncbi:hypothetical protein, variant 1 [Batrachochytrium dendrobatidis JEL423]|uniref:DUF1640 domain-containing protein n=1 Tax=Batrachochytrium dendrobatidis (strain JEL423) TaxID=403673 RepID=A0A177W9K6_BATDL|nr:hypothetical protein, variant 1 [Batrachochytrium dendrobatidis JEL423]
MILRAAAGWSLVAVNASTAGTRPVTGYASVLFRSYSAPRSTLSNQFTNLTEPTIAVTETTQSGTSELQQSTSTAATESYHTLSNSTKISHIQFNDSHASPSAWRKKTCTSPITTMSSPNNSISSTPISNRSFDIAYYSQMLQAEGFTPSQTQGLLALVEEAVNESLLTAVKSMVTKDEQREAATESEQDFQRLRSEIHVLEKKDFAILKTELERLIAETSRIKGSIQDEVNRVHGGVRLDVNLEKARINDEIAELNQLVANADTKIDKEIDELTKRMHDIRIHTKTFVTRTYALTFCIAFITSSMFLLTAYCFSY